VPRKQPKVKEAMIALIYSMRPLGAALFLHYKNVLATLHWSVYAYG
jgi:hypothetical protein